MSDSVTLWTVARQAPLSMEFSWQVENWSGLPFTPPVNLINTGIPILNWQAGSLPLAPPEKPINAGM